jgi:hypothetical protein
MNAPAVAERADFGLSFDATVERELVHKTAVEQVLVTGFVPLGEAEFACGGQAPRAHAYFSDSVAGGYDPLMLLESGRQAFVLAVHDVMDVPRSSQFLFVDLEMTVRHPGVLAVGSSPARLVWHAKLTEPRYIRGELTNVHAVADLQVDGQHCLDIAGTGAFMNERMYRLLRRRRAGAVEPPPEHRPEPGGPLPPAAVARRDPRNVVVTTPVRACGGAMTTDLLVDQGHLTFFDHPLDHVPAMLLVEGLRQTALASACAEHAVEPAAGTLASISIKYGRYAELDAPVRCVAAVGDAIVSSDSIEVPVTAYLDQAGTRVADCEMTLRFDPRP